MKDRGEKIAMVTAYDYTSARIVDDAGMPIILVGDSLGMVMLGYDTTVPVTMDEMIHHTKAVVRGAQKAHVVADLPFMSYQADHAEAMRNAGRLLKEGGAQSVKLEGGVTLADTVHRMVRAGIPVMGHIGLTPQSVNQLGGFKVQGRTSKAAVRLLEDARALEEAGAYAIVLETIPLQLSQMITERVKIPTIGIGSGMHCDGQVQVFQDLLGLTTGYLPRHAAKYADLGAVISDAVKRYVGDVKGGTFPTEKHSFLLKPEVVAALTAEAVEHK
jgi:3-methyl-2-oxobutanoate hydroxymethyltransferase